MRAAKLCARTFNLLFGFEGKKSSRMSNLENLTLKWSVWKRARGSRQTEKISIAHSGRCAHGLGWKALAPPFPGAWAAEEGTLR